MEPALEGSPGHPLNSLNLLAEAGMGRELKARPCFNTHHNLALALWTFLRGLHMEGHSSSGTQIQAI